MQKALILVDHGSRRVEANQKLDEVARSVAAEAGDRFVAVEPAHMELAPPTIAEAFERCVAAGARQVVIALFFLSPGRHALEDIPRLAAEAARGHPEVSWSITPPIGDHAGIAEVILALVDKTGDNG